MNPGARPTRRTSTHVGTRPWARAARPGLCAQAVLNAASSLRSAPRRRPGRTSTLEGGGATSTRRCRRAEARRTWGKPRCLSSPKSTLRRKESAKVMRSEVGTFTGRAREAPYRRAGPPSSEEVTGTRRPQPPVEGGATARSRTSLLRVEVPQDARKESPASWRSTVGLCGAGEPRTPRRSEAVRDRAVV